MARTVLSRGRRRRAGTARHRYDFFRRAYSSASRDRNSIGNEKSRAATDSSPPDSTLEWENSFTHGQMAEDVVRIRRAAIGATGEEEETRDDASAEEGEEVVDAEESMI